jgi:hypothetical protein
VFESLLKKNFVICTERQQIVDLDLLFKIPQKYARIIGGKGEEASSRDSTKEERERNAQEHTRNPKKLLGKKPLL